MAILDASPVLQFSEHVLDLVTLAVDCCIVRDGHLSVGLRWDAGGDAPFGQCVTEPVGIITPIGEQCLGPGGRTNHQRGALVVAHLPFAEQHDQRAAPAVADRVELGVQAAFGASDTFG